MRRGGSARDPPDNTHSANQGHAALIYRTELISSLRLTRGGADGVNRSPLCVRSATKREAIRPVSVRMTTACGATLAAGNARLKLNVAAASEKKLEHKIGT